MAGRLRVHHHSADDAEVREQQQQKPVCAICYEDIKPISDYLQCFPLCGHVLHMLCIQQWLVYCPEGKQPTCPVCKQTCSDQNPPIRLYFQSAASEPTQENFGASSEENGAALAEEVLRLKMELSAMSTCAERQRIALQSLGDEVIVWKEVAMREEERTAAMKREKEFMERRLSVKAEELVMKKMECEKLQEKSMALAKELAALKLATDLNLDEEDIMKLASLVSGGSPQDSVQVLKDSLILRSKKYKELIAQCSSLGRSESRAQRELDKAKEKIRKMKARLQQWELQSEEKENQILRNTSASKKLRTGGACQHQDHASKLLREPINEKPTSMFHKAGSSYMMDVDISSPLRAENSNSLQQGQQEDSVFQHPKAFSVETNDKRSSCVGATSTLLSSEKASYPLRSSDYFSHHTMHREITVVDSPVRRNTATKIPESDVLPIKVVSLTAQQENLSFNNLCHGHGGVFAAQGAQKNFGKWCRNPMSLPAYDERTNGDLIAVGPDGRGGKVKVLKCAAEPQNGKKTQASLKCQGGIEKKKNMAGAKRGAQFQINHFFGKP